MDQYIPGKCNIGREGKKRRMVFGVAVLSLTMFFFLISRSYFSKQAILLLAVPFSIGFMGIYQSLFSFCVNNGLRNVSEMS